MTPDTPSPTATKASAGAKVSAYCTCGASMSWTIKPAERAERMLRIFRRCHSGDGHEPCDQKTAAAARAREDRKWKADLI